VLHGCGSQHKPTVLLKAYKDHISHHNSLWSLQTQQTSLKSWDSIVTIAKRKRLISSAKHLDWMWGKPSLLSNGYWGLFLRRESGWGVTLTTNLHLAPRLRMRGVTPTLPLYALIACTGTTSPLPNADWKNVFPYWQVLHSHGYRQAKWTYKEESQGADTMSGMWTDYRQQQWQVEQWHGLW
jgi:hypothetical protein